MSKSYTWHVSPEENIRVFDSTLDLTDYTATAVFDVGGYVVEADATVNSPETDGNITVSLAYDDAIKMVVPGIWSLWVTASDLNAQPHLVAHGRVEIDRE